MVNKNSSTFMHDLNEEIERRLELIEEPTYQFVPALSKADKVCSVALILVSLILIIIAV